MTSMEPLRVRVAADGDLARLIVESVRLGLGECDVALLGVPALALHDFPPADCTLVGPTFAGRPGPDAVRALRAAGLDGPLVGVHVSAHWSDRDSAALGMVDSIDLAGGPVALAQAIAAATTLDEDSRPVRSLRRAQRLLAMGAVASGLQHALNNPLTALMAEAQLMEMEALPDEQRQAVQRMVELCRRVAAVVRRLDVVGASPAAG